MTHLNHQTNGASLEDCHTNFFALTDLCGIKWRKLVWGGSDGGAAAAGVNEPLDDPVLSSYSRCLAADILCVWRRVAVPPPQQQQQQQVFDLQGLAPPPPAPPVGHPQAPPLSLAAAKELWIFWYGEEPDLSELVASELITPDGEQGSWESGLSYECRSLLFKALHNLIERCLLSRDFVKLGKWFVQPYNGSKKISGASTTHLSFSFAFFVHGESTVCASVDVRRHPAVRRLSKRHLVQTQTSPMPQPVILAPFGLAGVLTGQAFRAADWTARLLEDWKRFFPLEGQRPAGGAQCTGAGARSEADAPPPVVEVLVGGIKMRYPSCYVLVTDMDDDATPSPPASPVRDSAGLAERAWQDCIYSCGGPPPPSSDQCTTEESDSMWEFVDPLKRANCSCSKCRKLHVGPQRWSRTDACSGGGGKSWSASCRKVPFHRRSPPPPLLLPPHEPLFCTPIIRQSHLQQHQTQAGGRCTPQGGPPSYPRNQTDSLPAVQSVGSPPSAAPSPLVEPHSQQRPPSSSGGAGTAGGGSDQTMPTLSPQQTPQATAQHSAGTMPQVPTPTPPASEEPGQIPSIPPAPTQASTTSSSCETTQATTTSSNILKRPILTVREYETALLDEEQPLELLYDYTTLTAWLDHPVKRFKPDTTFGQAAAANRNRHADLYSTGGGIKQETPDAALGAVAAFIKQEIKQEPNVDCAMDPDKISVPGMKRPGDPYEFEEHDNSTATGNVHMDNFKRTGTPNIKEEPGNKDSGTKCSSDLFTTEGLQASFKDLDQIFDNSDDTSGDEGLQVQTPPGSNKSVGMNGLHDDNTSKRIGCHSGNAGSTGILRPEELSKMFPTPPSMEHNPVASPCGQLDGGPHSIEPSEIKQEIYPLMGSPRDEPIDDWSYVFRPPAICRMVGSSKYAPLTNLPSQSLPPVTVPSHCVYKPSWRKQQQTSGSSSVGQQQVTSQTQQQQQSVTGTTSSGQQPVSLQQRGRPLCASVPPPPPPYEMPSPAPSTASSYLNKTLNSVEPATPSLGQRQPEADSLLVNILLADTALNIFRDHNFDSCTLCVCNAGPKVVGNIRGADASTYLVPAQPPGSPLGVSSGGYSSGMSPPRHTSAMSPDDDPIRCSCGFSAVVNRRLSHRSGLFYEDEMEITGIAEDPGERKKSSLVSCLTSVVIENKEQLDSIPQNVIETVREQCVIIQSNSNSLCRAAHTFRGGKAAATPHTSTVNVLEFTDGNEITGLALEGGGKSGSGSGGALYVHRWPFLRAAGPHCNQDIVRVMHCLQPLLQDAIQKKCTTRLWEAPYTVKGPLTWRQFHRLAGRGTDDRCEPQPVPSLVVGHDKDWLSLSPYALQHWDKLLLEPYSYSRDVAYVVVAPDSEAVLPRVKSFFRELSAIYEVCKLGRHAPITKALRDSIIRDGILRVGKTTPSKQASEAMDEWFAALPDTAMTEVLKLYAQACRHQLAPHLCQVPMDKTLLEPENNSSSASPMSAPPLPSSNSNDTAPSTPKNDSNESGNDTTTTVTLPQSSSDASMHDDDELSPPAIVIYLVEPFTMGTDRPELQRLACLALLRCFTQVIQAVPDNVRQNVHVQLVSQESIVELTESRERARHGEHMRALAFSVFSKCRRLLIHTSNIKSLTGFGTAAMADLFLKGKDEKNRAPYKLYTPPYILAPLKERAESAESFGQTCAEDCSVLYISYCLSEDQSWLLAAATDERGEILETVTVNVDVPNRSRRRKASARRIGLQRLMDWILGVMSQSVRPWRLVVGRVGRIGHGELKGWSWLLSKKSLLKASKHLKELCGQCSLMYPSGVPCLLSACLVSLEPDSALRLMADQFTPDERFSQASVNCQLSTPADVSCTHILVFPTSATTQSSQTAFQEQHINGPELGDCELFEADILNDDMTDDIEGMNDFSDIFSGVWTETGPGGGHSPGTSPRRDGCNSPTGGSPGGCGVLGGEGDRPSPFPCDGGGGGSGRGAEHIMQEEVGTLLQQPLALGYLVSTAPTGRMPGWFWAQCPHLEHVCPVFLKNALHLHSPAIQQNSDDLLQQQSAVTVHPLDSQYTTDVLRYVLEGYNALSWLAIDSNTHDRRSCLPVHIQVLMQLYHLTAALL